MNTLLTAILGPVFKIIDKVVPDTAEATRLKAEIEKATIANQAELMKTMREIAVAEVSGNWFQSSWRPLLSYTFIFLVLWVYFIKGVLEATFGITIESGSAQEIMALGTVWSAVYGLGRSFEKTGSQIKIRGK